MPSPIRIVHDSLNARLVGGTASARATVDKLLSYRTEGWQFSKAFKEGKWDGWTHLLKADGSFPSGLWSYVASHLYHAGYSVRHVDTRAPARGRLPAMEALHPKIKLRPYQEDAVAAALEKEVGVLHMATGAGKTEVMIVTTQRLARRTLVMAHRWELVRQTADRYVLGLQLPKNTPVVGVIGNSAWMPADITVAMFQTVYARLDAPKRFVKGYLAKRRKIWAKEGRRKAPTRSDVAGEPEFQYGLAEAQEQADIMTALLAEFDVVFFDECHHVPAPTFYKVALAIPAHYRYGASATPDKNDATELMLVGATGPAIYEETAAELIEGGYAVAPEIFMLDYDIDPTLEKELSEREETQTLPWQASLKDRRMALAGGWHAWGEYQDGIVENSRRNKLIQLATDDLRALGHTILILVDRIEHGEHLQRILVDSIFLHGTSGMAKRKTGLKDMAAGRRPIVIATSIFDEGVDVPAISCLIVARGGKAEHRSIQAVGRGMRPDEGKDRLIVIDFFDAFSRRLRKHSRERLAAYKGVEGFTVHRWSFDVVKDIWR